MRERLLTGYVVLGAAITGISAVGARAIYGEVETRASARAHVFHDIKWLAATGSAAAEESFSYLLTGDQVERRNALGKYEDLCSSARQLHGEVAALGLPTDLALTVQLDACHMGESGAAMFASYERTGRPTHETYQRSSRRRTRSRRTSSSSTCSSIVSARRSARARRGRPTCCSLSLGLLGCSSQCWPDGGWPRAWPGR